MLEERYEKSEAGRAEIKKRALIQARVARNLLLVIDPSKTGGQWVAVVQGAAPADLELLLQHGLVTPAGGAVSRPAPLGAPEPGRAAAAQGPAAAPAAVTGATPTVMPAVTPAASVAPASQPVAGAAPAATAAVPGGVPPSTRPSPSTSTRPMGAPVSRLDFQQLYTALTVFAKQQGLLKGYRMALEVEQCQDFEQLQTLALDVVDRVRATKGDAAAHELRETLGFN